MRMSRRAGLLSPGNLPTWEALFNSIRTYSHNGWAGTTSVVRSMSRPSNATDGQTWYLFYMVGSCMEVSRIEMLASNKMSKTRLGTYRPTEDTAYQTKLSSDATSIEGTAVIRAGSMIFLRFGYSPSIIDRMFAQGSIGTLQSYQSNTASSENADLRVPTADITAHQGVAFAAFRDITTSSNIWGIVNTQSSTTIVKGANGSSWLTISPLRGFTTSSISYRTPTANGTTNASVKSYTLKYLSENW